MEPVMGTKPDALDNFITFLFEGLEGYAYLAAKEPKKGGKWLQEFFAYPKDVSKLKATIRQANTNLEIYLAPALFNDNVLTSHEPAARENVKCSNVVWTEFDGNAPDWSDFAGPPSLIVQSSNKGHHHVYWKLNEPLYDIDRLEDLNRKVTYNFSADQSAWDANQVLRPPNTFNHKRQATTYVVSDSLTQYDPDLFDSLDPVPAQDDLGTWQLGELPTAQDVATKYTFPPDLRLLMAKSKQEIQDRSAAIMQLAYGCCEMGMSDAEVFVMLMAADDVWEKFKYRKDRVKRLTDAVLKARKKHPEPEPSEEIDEGSLFIWDYKTFLEAEIDIDWVLEGMLMEQGNMLMAGPSGIGKTQFTLEIMKHVALGKDYLHYKVPSPKKILFLSLEMGHPDLQIFMRAQDQVLSPDERELLAENLLIIPHGEAWPLNDPHGQTRIKEVLDELQPDGLFVDSIGSAVLGNINSQDVVQPFVNFNDHLRKKYQLFTWYIHHTRKAQHGQQVSGQDDIYGDQYLNNRASSSYLVLPGKEGTIKIRNTKQRLAAKEEDYYLKRSEHLTFSKVSAQVDALLEQVKGVSTDEPTAGGFVL